MTRCLKLRLGTLITGAALFAAFMGQAGAATPPRSALATAEHSWPSAKLISSGAHFGPGQYLMPDGRGHFVHIVLGVAERERGAVRAEAARTMPAARAASFCYGCVYGVTANVSLDSFLWGHQEMDTYNGVSYGRYAWNINNSPWCRGAGSCQQPIYNAIGNYTSTVNPWANIIVNYWGCCTRTAFLRVYVNKYANVSGWAVMN